MIIESFICPCCSGKKYSACCQLFHQGQLPPLAVQLMRSRYCAYALGLSQYIIDTTHSKSPLYIENKNEWRDQIQQFYSQVKFEKLEILDTQISNEESFVTFIAHLKRQTEDLTFTEKSRFLKEGQAWKYIEGKVVKGCLTAYQMNKYN